MTARRQPDLLSPRAVLDGFQYRPGAITADLEQQLLEEIRGLPFKAFEFRGFEGKRRVVSYGWRYDFNQQKLQEADPPSAAVA